MAYPTSRAEAQRLGVDHYFTGRACQHGHYALRKTINSSCMTCHRLDQRRRNQVPEEDVEEMRNWKEGNGELT